jgi:hypothetical protein
VCQSSDTFQVLAFRDFLVFFVQPDVHEAEHPPNMYNVPLRHDDLIDWKANGVQPQCEGHHGASSSVKATERAHKRIFHNFRSVLAVLEYSFRQDITFNTWTKYLHQNKFVLMSIPQEFYEGAMAVLARHHSDMEAAIQASFPLLQKSLREWGLYQPYNQAASLPQAMNDYLHLFGKDLPDPMSKNNAVIYQIAACFEFFVVCFLPRHCLQRLIIKENLFGNARFPRRSL